GEVIAAEMLDFLTGALRPPEAAGRAVDVEDTTIGESLDTALRARIEGALRSHGGNIRRTAAELGISRNKLRARMDKYGLPDRDRETGAGRAAPSRPSPRPTTGTPVHWERRHLAFLPARVRS